MNALDMTGQKNIFAILGTARTGTSVIARALKALGVDLGTRLTPANGWNPKGFWEDNDIVYQVNEKVLQHLGYAWDSVRVVDKPLQLSSSLDEIKLFAVDLLKKRFVDTDYWGFKDPRTAKILVFWQAVFKEIAIHDNYIIALRNPLSSALSYQRLTGKDVEHGLLLWLIHLLTAVEQTAGKNRMIVSYDLLMQNPRLQLERIQKKFSLSSRTDTSELDKYINTFLDKDLLHYEHHAKDLCSHTASAVAPSCAKLYENLLRIAKDEVSFDDPDFLFAWQEIKNEFSTFAPLYAYADSLIQKNSQLERTLKVLHKSRLWKLIYPLRMVDEALRQYRKQKKKC
jgi:hypothetical protein